MLKLQRHLSLILILIFIFIIPFLSQFFQDDLKIEILNIFRIPLKIISNTYYVLRNIPNFKEIVAENKILKQNIENLERELLKSQEARLENERLRNLLAFNASGKTHFIPSMVIGKDLSDLRYTIIIDKGKRDGIRKDMVVVSGNGLVGRVRECGWGIARVLLIVDHDSSISGLVQRTRDEGILVGNGRAGLIMKYLGLDSDVKKGDKVITSGFGAIFKKGILIGEVVSVDMDESNLYLKAVVKPEVDIFRLEEVLVMKP